MARRGCLLSFIWPAVVIVVCAHLAFDVLDLDGSNSQSQMRTASIVGAEPMGEIEPPFQLDLLSDASWLPAPTDDALLVRLRTDNLPAPVWPSLRRSHLLPRKQLGLTAAAIPAGADPV